jgi:hypothetical protein
VSKIFKLLLLLGILVAAYLVYVVAKKENETPEECEYNIIKICKGKCCRKCELEHLCNMACKENPEQCGGRIHY